MAWPCCGVGWGQVQRRACFRHRGAPSVSGSFAFRALQGMGDPGTAGLCILCIRGAGCCGDNSLLLLKL